MKTVLENTILLSTHITCQSVTCRPLSNKMLQSNHVFDYLLDD